MCPDRASESNTTRARRRTLVSSRRLGYLASVLRPRHRQDTRRPATGRARAGAWSAWRRAGARCDACLEWVAPLVEPLATLAVFLVVRALLGATTAPSSGSSPGPAAGVTIDAIAAAVAQLAWVLGHWAGTFRRTTGEPGASVDGARYQLVPFAGARDRATTLAALYARFLVFHLPLFWTFGPLPDASPVRMLDLQLIALLFAFGGHRTSLHATGIVVATRPGEAWRAREVLALALVLALAAALRFYDLDYNGEFIDESFYAYAVEVGNVFFISSDSRMWPSLAARLYALDGVVAMRAVTSLFGVLTVLCVYLFARAWSAEMRSTDDVRAVTDRDRAVALVAAFLAAVSSPTVVTSVVGRHDALAFLVFAFALAQLARAARDDRPVAMLLGGSALMLALMARYAMSSYLPLGALLITYAVVVRRRAYLDALLPVALMALVWLLFDLEHFRIAWDHSRRTPFAPPATIFLESLARVPVVLIGVALGALLLARDALSAQRDRVRRLVAIAIPVLGTADIVAAHMLLARTALSLERNLTLAVMFGAVLAATFLLRLAGRMPSTRARVAAAAALAVLTTLHGLRIVEGEKHAWGDPRPVIAAVERALARHGLGPETVVWSTDSDGGKGNVHALVLALRGKALVDASSPWKSRFWAEAREQEIGVIAGSNRADPQTPLAPGTVVRGYVVEEQVAVPDGPPAHVYVRRDLARTAPR